MYRDLKHMFKEVTQKEGISRHFKTGLGVRLVELFKYVWTSLDNSCSTNLKKTTYMVLLKLNVHMLCNVLRMQMLVEKESNFPEVLNFSFGSFAFDVHFSEATLSIAHLSCIT